MSPTILFITGPSGSGKSTTARAWADSWETACALIDHDLVRHFIRAGFADPGLRWGEDEERQWALARTICCDMARRYIEAGIACIIDAFAPPDEYRRWQEELADLAVRVVVLLPSVDVALARNAGRSGDALLRDASVRENHGWMALWRNEPTALIIDNGQLSVDAVLQHMARA